jgi:hypothetical protein
MVKRGTGRSQQLFKPKRGEGGGGNGGGGGSVPRGGRRRRERGALHSGRPHRTVSSGPQPVGIGSGTIALTGENGGARRFSVGATDRWGRAAVGPSGSGRMRERVKESRAAWRGVLARGPG